jgi:thiol-disulfide isomerase/thioredoxin
LNSVALPRRAWIGLTAFGIIAGLAAVYGLEAFSRNRAGDRACRATTAVAQRVAPLARGEVAALTIASAPKLMPDISFTDAEGRPRSLAEWRGRTVLLNLWATWCVPCRQEMPALDALQARLGSQRFEVVAVNIDTRNLERPKTWLRDAKVERLGYYADPSAKVFQDLKAAGNAYGMPTTVLIDPSGCEIGTVAGPAEWASPDAIKLVEAALGS